jgi:hypothetical protein
MWTRFISIVTDHWLGLTSLVTAGWFLWLFIIKREATPGSELELDVDFVGQQDDKWLIEVVAKLTNRSSVRNWYDHFRVVVRYFLPSDTIVDGPSKVNHQLLCTRSIDERIDGQTRHYANAAYIDPHLTFRHSYVTYIPKGATFVWVQVRLIFRHRDLSRLGKKVAAIKNTQRLFKVPSTGA